MELLACWKKRAPEVEVLVVPLLLGLAYSAVCVQVFVELASRLNLRTLF